MRLTWRPITSQPGSWSARAGDVCLFVAQSHSSGFRLKCKLPSTGYLCYCGDLNECKQRADKAMSDWLNRTRLNQDNENV